MVVKDLNIRFIKSLLTCEIKDFYEKSDKAELQESKVNTIRSLLDLFENQNLLRSNIHTLTDDFESLIKNFELIETLLPYVFDESYSKIKYLSDKILSNAKICDNWVKNKANMSSSEYVAAKKELIKVLNMLRDRYQEEHALYISIRPNHSEITINYYKIIRDNLSNNIPIESFQYDILKKLFLEKNIPEKERIILLERLKNHNIYCHKKLNNETFDFPKAYEIIDMISFGYEDIQIPNVDSDRKGEISFYCKTVENMVEESKRSDKIGSKVLTLLPHYEGNLIFSGNYSKEEFDYLMLSLLKDMQNSLYLYATYLSDNSVYNDKIDRNNVKNDYYKYLEVYLVIRNYYDKQVELYEKVEELDENSIENLPDVYTLSFTSRGVENEKTYFEADLKSVSKDLYPRVIKHLTYFKKDRLPKTYLKPITELGTGTSEIKDDQIRIVFRRVKDNEYAIMGIFVKKDNNDRMMYRKLAGRNMSTLLSGEEIENEVFNLLNLKKHKGGRKNS